MEIGNTVKLVQPVVQGEITDTQYNKESKQLEHLVEWIDAAGDAHQRWFVESQLEVAGE